MFRGCNQGKQGGDNVYEISITTCDKVFFLKTCMPYGGVEAKKELTDKHVFRYLNTR